MNFGAIIKQAKKAAADNAPTILTAIGVTGTVTTAVLASKASFKAAEVIREANKERQSLDYESKGWDDLKNPKPLDTQESIKLVWPLYVPAVGTCALTVAAIVGANHLSTTRAAALASAYSVSQEAFKTYKEKVTEKIGEKKEQAVRDEIAQEQVRKNPPPAEVVIGTGNHLCYDSHSGRYFMSTLEGLKKGENDTNYEILHSGYASLTDYWDNIGLPKTSESDEVGWSSDTKLEVEYGTALSEDSRPCITVTFRTFPVRGYGSIF